MVLVPDPLLRLETWAIFDNPDKPWRMRLGDSVTTSVLWSRVMRFGGFQWTRDFGMRPDMVTMPLPVAGLDIASPSAVDLFVNGIRRYTTQVKPGPLRLQDLPVLSGSNRMSMVVTDTSGRRTVVDMPFYQSPILLAEGLSRFSIEGGAARDRFAVASNDYGPGFGLATFDYGLTNAITMESFVGAAKDYGALGLGAAFKLGRVAVINMTAGYSDAPQRSGLGGTFSIERVTPHYSVSARYIRAGNYTDFGDLFGNDHLPEQLVASASLNFGRYGNLNGAYTLQKRLGHQSVSVVSGTYGLNMMHNRLHFTTSGYLDAVGESWGLLVSLSLSVGRDGLAYAQQHVRDGKRSTSVEYTDSSFDQRLTYAAEVLAGEVNGGEMEAGWDGARARAYGRVAHYEGASGVQAQFGQSILFMDGELGFSAPVDDAFALVQLEGLPGVRVYRENRFVGRTNAAGNLFVAGLPSYYGSTISLNFDDVPPDASIVDTSLQVAPRGAAGVVARFHVLEGKSATIVLQMPDGGVPPVGATVVLRGSARTSLMGYSGQTYVEELQPGKNILDVVWASGNCQVMVEVPRGRIEQVIGPLTCVS